MTTQAECKVNQTSITMLLLTLISNLIHRSNIKLIVLTFLLLPVFYGNGFGQQTIRLATLEWPPYIGENLPEQGYVAELISTAFKRKGYDVTFLFMPWQRALDWVAKGHYEGVTPAYYTKKRAVEYSVSDPFPGAPLVFIKRKNSKIKYTQLKDLIPYKIACAYGYAYTKEFDEAKYLQKSFTNNDTTGYRRLLFGTVDLWVADKFIAQYTISSHLPERAIETEIIKKSLSEQKLYIMFTKKIKDYKKFTQAFNQGLSSVMTDGTFEAILARHGLNFN